MATKNYCFSSNDNKNAFVSDNLDGEINNFNLNQNHKCLSLDTVCSKSIQTTDKRTNSNFDFDYSRKNLWNKCDNKTLSFHDSSIFDAFEKEKLKKEKHLKINNSTLSLHISAYENLIEALGDSNGSENEGMKEKKIQTNFTDSVSLLQNRFEFPRQQENQEIEPEIMQFKTSQRLLNPNLFGREPALNSVKMDDLTFGIEEELELDYEAEEARKAKEIAAARTSGSLDDNDQEDGEEGKIEGDNDGEEEEFEKSDIKLPSNSRKRKSSPVKWNRGIIADDDEVEPGQDNIRTKKTHKRFRFQPKLLPAIFFPDEKDPDEPLDDEVDEHPALKRSDVEELFDSLDVDMDDESVPLNTVYVYGAEGMTHYQIEKIFAEYNPHIVLFVDDSSCIVQFRQSRLTAKMLIGMTKKLKRIRKAKKIEEEGEIMDSDGEEEDGQIKNEDGEMIEIVNKDSNIDVTDIDQEEVEIDIKKFKVPKGKWRVVSKHVQSNKVLIVRYAKQTEIQKANRNTANTDYRTERSNSAVKNRNNRAKSGINVFDSTGKELPWNFEHDTRIFSDPALKDLEVSYEVQKKLNPEQPHEENIQIGDRTIRSRGRGTKRALNLHFSSDEEESDDEKDEDEPMKEAPPSESQTKEAAKEVIDDSILDSPPPSPPKASDNFRNQILGKK